MDPLFPPYRKMPKPIKTMSTQRRLWLSFCDGFTGAVTLRCLGKWREPFLNFSLAVAIGVALAAVLFFNLS